MNYRSIILGTKAMKMTCLKTQPNKSYLKLQAKEIMEALHDNKYDNIKGELYLMF